MQAERTSQECGRFLRSEPEISRTDFGQVTARAQACQGKRGICPCRHDQVELVRQMVDEIRDGSMDRWRGDQVVVIQDEHHLVGQGGKAIDPDGQDGFYGWELLGVWSLKQSQGGCTTAWVDALQGGEHIGPEAAEVIIATL